MSHTVKISYLPLSKIRLLSFFFNWFNLLLLISSHCFYYFRFTAIVSKCIYRSRNISLCLTQIMVMLMFGLSLLLLLIIDHYLYYYVYFDVVLFLLRWKTINWNKLILLSINHFGLKLTLIIISIGLAILIESVLTSNFWCDWRWLIFMKFETL